MKDIPVFDTENGVASLFLREIPYTGRAHIKIQSSQCPEEFLAECVQFCKACGADWIDAAGHEYLSRYPMTTRILEMSRSMDGMDTTDALLFPVQKDTIENWRNILNDRMANVPNAAYMTPRENTEQLARGDGYFIHRNGELLGIGRAGGDTIELVVSVKPGSGRDVVLALSTLITDERVRLVVADSNARAVRLYERLGFLVNRELSRWYKIL